MQPEIPLIPEIEGLNEDQVRTLMNCRTFAQYTSMIEDYRAGKCPFCNPLDKKNKVIYENELWRVWKNSFPLEHTALHLVIAHQEHYTTLGQLGLLSWIHLGDIVHMIRDKYKEFKLVGGCIAMRFGSPALNAGSVLHLHANIIVPDTTGSVQVTLAKTPDKIAETIRRMHVFERLRLGTMFDDLDPKSRELIIGRIK